MGFRNFRLNILGRVFLLIFLLYAMVWGFVATSWEVTPIASGVLAVLILVELIHYVERTNRRFSSFLEFVSHQDFSSASAGSGLGRSFDDLSEAYQVIAGEMRRLNVQREVSAQYLASVVEHISIALLCLDSNGEISLMNQQAKRMFRSPYLQKLQDLKKFHPELPQLIEGLQDQEQALLNLNISDEEMQLAIYATDFQLLDQSYKLVSFQNIRDELERQEIDSWQKLISVLTHEIMNSVTPIISLTEVIKGKLVPGAEEGATASKLSDEEFEDMQRGITSIESRSKGLHHFVQTYRQLTDIPTPHKSRVVVGELVRNAATLLSAELDKQGVDFSVSGDAGDEEILVDAQQIEQVLINLVKNAVDATSRCDSPKIQLQMDKSDNSSLVLRVSDNGPGIASEHLDQIFVPFFTTKEEGTGIGLSISRQIVVSNGGTLSVSPSVKEGAAFLLRFRKSS